MGLLKSPIRIVLDASNPTADGRCEPPATFSKLYSGGGEEVAHSSVQPSQGSSPARTAFKYRMQDVIDENGHGDHLNDNTEAK